MFANGQDLVQRLDNVLDSIQPEKLEGVVDIQPLKLIICDLNMPIMDGLEAITAIKEMFLRCNNNLLERDEEEKVIDTINHATEKKVLKPLICFLTQAEFQIMKTF